MRLLILSALTISYAWCQPTLAVRQISVGVAFPGTSLQFEVDLGNSSNTVADVIGMLIAGGPITNVQVGTAAAGASKFLNTTALDSTYSVVGVSGFISNAIPDGQLLTFTYKVPSKPVVASGTVINFGAWNVTAGRDTSSHAITLINIPSSITVTDQSFLPAFSFSSNTAKGKD